MRNVLWICAAVASALTGVAARAEGDGLDALRMIAAGAAASLVPGGWLLLEHGYDQGAAVRSLLAGAAFQGIETRRDLGGHERATGGRLASS